MGESCTSSERPCGACAGARGQRSPEKNRKSKAACVMSPCGGGGFRAHKASYLSWRHVIELRKVGPCAVQYQFHCVGPCAVQYQFHCGGEPCGKRTRRDERGVSHPTAGRDPISDMRLHVWFLGRVGSPAAASEPPIFTLTYSHQWRSTRCSDPAWPSCGRRRDLPLCRRIARSRTRVDSFAAARAAIHAAMR